MFQWPSAVFNPFILVSTNTTVTATSTTRPGKHVNGGSIVVKPGKWQLSHTALWNARHYFVGDRNSPWLLDMGTSWYFSWKLNHFGIPKWKQGLFNIPQSGHESVYLLEPSFHSRTPNNSTFMKNISWCPCLKVRVNFYLRRNNAAHFTVVSTLRKSSGNKMMPSYRHLRPVLVLPPPVTTLPPPISQWVSKLSKLWTSR